MVSVRLYKRRKRLCQVTTLWCFAIFIAALGGASSWWARSASVQHPWVLPAVDLGEPDLPQPAAASLPVNGDGMVDTPNVILRLIPVLAQEASDALQRGDAGLALEQFNRWIFSGEALHSGAFWVFWSVIGAGILAVTGWSLIHHYLITPHDLPITNEDSGNDAGGVSP